MSAQKPSEEQPDDITKGEILSRNSAVDAIKDQVKTQKITDALNQAKAQAQLERANAQETRTQASQQRISHINKFTGLVENADGSHEFSEGGIVDENQTMSQVKSYTLKKLEEIKFDKMTADELKAAYETAKAVEADKAQEAELFKNAHDLRVQKDLKVQKEQQMASKEAEKKPKRHHKKNHKKHHEDVETQSEINTKYVNDLYDGKLSNGLENGAKKNDFSSYTPDHYDSKKPESKKAKGDDKKANAGKGMDAKKGKDAKNGGVPLELKGTKDTKKETKVAKKQSKAQTESTPEDAE